MTETSTSTKIEQALKILSQGGLIGLPTETVYGLAGDARNPRAVTSIYALKKRPQFNPLIAHVPDMDSAERQAVFSELGYQLADAFWPGPLTLVLPVSKTNSVCSLARSGLDTQALRCPAHSMARTILSEFGAPLTAPSANRSGKISPTRAAHVHEEFGADLPCILDGGASVLGLESSVIRIDGDKATLLRAGSLDRQKIEDVIGPIAIAGSDNDAPRSPGMLSRHYSPDAKLRLNAELPEPGEAFLAFGTSPVGTTLNLSESGDVNEAAANLFDMLRTLDNRHNAIAVAPIPETGLGEAINDRLRRAATSDQN